VFALIVGVLVWFLAMRSSETAALKAKAELASREVDRLSTGRKQETDALSALKGLLALGDLVDENSNDLIKHPTVIGLFNFLSSLMAYHTQFTTLIWMARAACVDFDSPDLQAEKIKRTFSEANERTLRSIRLARATVEKHGFDSHPYRLALLIIDENRQAVRSDDNDALRATCLTSMDRQKEVRDAVLDRLGAIESHAVRDLPGNDDAPWGL
jgi:hypothetical protein